MERKNFDCIPELRMTSAYKHRTFMSRQVTDSQNYPYRHNQTHVIWDRTCHTVNLEIENRIELPMSFVLWTEHGTL